MCLTPYRVFMACSTCVATAINPSRTYISACAMDMRPARKAPAIPGQGHHSLPCAVPASLDTSRHGALVVRSILRDLPGLIRGPSLALRLVDGLLLSTLAVLRIHEYLTRNRRSIIVGRLVGRLPLAAIIGRRRGIGLRRGRRWRRILRRRTRTRAIGIRHRRRVRRHIPVIIRRVGVVHVIRVVVRIAAPPIGGIGQGQDRQEPREAYPVVRTRPEPAAPVAAPPVSPGGVSMSVEAGPAAHIPPAEAPVGPTMEPTGIARSTEAAGPAGIVSGAGKVGARACRGMPSTADVTAATDVLAAAARMTSAPAAAVLRQHRCGNDHRP